MFTLDHVVHSFRARSQMLINQLEEEDEVLTKNYHSDYDEPEEQEESVNEKGEAEGTSQLVVKTFDAQNCKQQFKS